MKMVIDLHQMEYKKPTPILSLIIAAYKKQKISGEQARIWSMQNSTTRMVHVLYMYIWASGKGKVRNRYGYITSALKDDYSLPDEFLDWFKNERKRINDDKNVSIDVKRLVNL